MSIEVEQKQEKAWKDQVKTAKTLAVIDHEALDELQDTYCALREKLDPDIKKFKILTKELDGADEALQTALDEIYAVSQPVVRQTQNYLLDASARKKARIVKSKEKLIEFLGVETFLKVAEVSIKDMEKYLTAQQLDEVLVEIHKNKRSLNFSKL